CSCSALLALRMRVSMSAIGSVSTVSLLPARLRHAGNRALVGELPQADPAEPELAEDRAGAAAPVTARVVAHLELLGSPLLDDERCLGHLPIPPVAVRDGQAERLQQREGMLVGLGARRDRHVETADLLDVVVVDLREDELLADTEREIAPAVERARAQTAEVADPRQGNRDEPVEELVHPRAAQC